MKRKIYRSFVASLLAVFFFVAFGQPVGGSAQVKGGNRITVRIERYPRPPYSGATYYIYERDGEIICTKLQVCNKYDQCDTEYRKGSFKEDEDIQTGEPFGKENPVLIPKAKLRKHVCLTRFSLLTK